MSVSRAVIPSAENIKRDAGLWEITPCGIGKSTGNDASKHLCNVMDILSFKFITSMVPAVIPALIQGLTVAHTVARSLQGLLGLAAWPEEYT